MNRTALMIVVWLWVLVPFGYGIYELIQNVIKIFKG